MSDNKNEPAFACAAENGHQVGMTKREYAAIHILAGMVADPETDGETWMMKNAVIFADKLFERLDKPAYKRGSNER